MFPDVPAATLDPVIAPYLDGDGNIDFVFSSVVVWLGERIVLLDAGPAASPVLTRRAACFAMQAADVSPTDVDNVVISHGHDDHIGGHTGRSSTVTFANARHYVSADEFDHWMSEPNREELGGRNLTVLAATGTLTRVSDKRGRHRTHPAPRTGPNSRASWRRHRHGRRPGALRRRCPGPLRERGAARLDLFLRHASAAGPAKPSAARRSSR